MLCVSGMTEILKNQYPFLMTHLGPLHMSLATGLARLPGRILWYVHMRNFSPVHRDEFKKHNQNGGT